MERAREASEADRAAVWAAARAEDLDRYLAALLAPRAVRDDLITLAAYLGDVARIPLTVSEPTLGRIRLQWWRDAVTSTDAGSRTGNPVADALREMTRRRTVPQSLVLAPLEARERELDPHAIDGEVAFLAHFDDAEGAGLRIAAHLAAAPADPETDCCLTAAGRALAAARLALNLPRLLARNRLPVPQTLVAGLNLEGTSEDDARRLARETQHHLIDVARRSLAEVRATPSPVLRGLAPALLPVALVEPYLGALEAAHRDPLRELADISPLRRVAGLWLARWRGRF